MKKNTLIATLGVAVLLVTNTAFAAGLGLGVNASASVSVGTTNVNAGVSASATARAKIIANVQQRADAEITRRITALNALNTRVNAMVRVSADEKASLASTIQSQITLMNNLQAQIATDVTANTTTSLKADVQSITQSYRIFALIIPQGAIVAASDRVQTIASMMTTLSGKLQTRITAAQSAGVDMTTSVSALADMNAKVADANTQAQAAVTETASLQPDNGNATIMASNTAALKDARTKIQASQQDLITARQDAGVIVKALIAANVSANASTSVSASGTAQ
jgi:hypothetical protein